MMLLAFLPDSFKNFIDTLVRWCNTSSLEDVKFALISKQWQKKLQDDNLSYDMMQVLVIWGREEHR